MSTNAVKPIAAPARIGYREGVKMADKKENVQNYKGFVAGVFSGIAKLTGTFTTFIPSLSPFPPPSIYICRKKTIY